MSGDTMNNLGARAKVVNRTHRIVREQALIMQEQRSRSRSFVVPIVICSALMAFVCYAVWAMLDGYDVTPSGIPDASDQMFVFMLWSLPVSAALLGFAWLRRARARSEVQR
jgi:TRAP-type C4-dicarboxylate transport system permease small subunit